ncbi:MAG: DinB family protein [Acidobacteriaceae bacterium]|nr:DinB family protein [Acidobacteriaceae bacterium]
MTPGIHRAFEKFEFQKQALLERLASWPPETIQYRPAKAAWSAIHVIDHLARVENGLIASLRANLPQGSRLTLGDQIRAFFLIAFMRTPVRVKVPSAAGSTMPAPGSELTGVITEWNTVRSRLKGLLDSVSPSELHRGVFRHPVSGWMTVGQALAFLSAHIRHHKYQLHSIRRKSGL